MPNVRRTIQWFGLLRFPPEVRLDRVHWYRVTAYMVRRPIAEYRNDGIWQPPRGFWGNIIARRDGLVLGHNQLEFPDQVVMSASNQEAVLMSALVCHLDAQLISIERLAALLGLVVFPRNNPIRTWKPIASCPSEFSVKMQSENAIADFLLEWEEIPRCSAENTEPPEVPPPPPRRDLPPPLNPSEPFDGEISDAYDGSTDSGQTYNPDPDGGVPDFPIGDVCVRYRIVVLYWLDGESLSSPGTQTSGTFYAPIDDVILSSFNGDPTNSVVVRSRGDASFEQCGDGLVERPLVLNNVQKFTIVDISEVV